MPWFIYASFVLVIAFLIYFDLSVLHRKAKAVSVRSALFWTGVWVCLSLLFNVVIYVLYQGNFVAESGEALKLTGKDAALQYFTGYLIEYSLSLDNIFVIAMIISSFRVPEQYQHRLLFWGILGAALLRGLMIWIGAEMMHRFDWTIYLFGALLIFSAAKMLMSGDEEIDPDRNILVRIVRRFYPVSHEFHGKNFFANINGKVHATPMLLALILIEGCDVVFAVDSIPAVFGVTKDPFLVFTSNIFAILGLRSLYFALAGMMGQFEYLKYSLIVLLFFVGIKMLLSDVFHISNLASLAIIGTILAIGVVTSLMFGKKHEEHAEPGSDDVPPA
ncbi:TerC family protein [Planctomicrobium sp. SH661]|uniref:TerC family protein n=1 Tax=Planctomicrobium sp. SH661 TaxID=3448124 RepID=UPI003F5BB041